MIFMFRKYEDDVAKYYKEKRGREVSKENDESERGIIAVLKKLLFIAVVCAVLYVSIMGAYKIASSFYENGNEEYGFLSRDVEDTCSVVRYNGMLYLITDEKHNGYLPLISGCIEFNQNTDSISVLDSSDRNYIRLINLSYVRDVEYVLREHEGTNYLELYKELGDSSESSAGNLLLEGIFREILKGYSDLMK